MPLARLEKWLGSVGVSIEAEKVRIKTSNGGLGVFAVADVTKGDLLCTIPKAAVLSVKTSGIADLLEENRIRGASFCREHSSLSFVIRSAVQAAELAEVSIAVQ